MAEQSKMNRLEVGDKVSYQDVSEWPPVDMEGEVTAFANDEKSYLEVTFNKAVQEGEETDVKDDVRVLTEDEVKRIG